MESAKVDFSVAPAEFPKGSRGNRRLYFDFMLTRRMYERKQKDPKKVRYSFEEIGNYYKLIIEAMQRRKLKVPKATHPLDRYIGRVRKEEANAMYLPEPHAFMIWSGKKTLILKKARFPGMLNKELQLTGETKNYGIIRLTSMKEVTRAQVRATRFAHQVTEEEIKRWWGDPKKLYLYTFVFRRFAVPREIKLPKGAQTFYVLKVYDDDYFWDLDLPRTPDFVIDLSKVCQNLEGLSVLSLGCGEGTELEILRRAGYKVKGIEKFEQPWMRCIAKDLDVILADAQEIPFEDNSFDSVFSMHLLEHVFDDKKVLEESLRVARKIAIHVVPLGKCKDVTHLRIYTPQDI